jgi:hypothetical protein
MDIPAWEMLLAKYNHCPRCAMTGLTWEEAELTVDHIIPRHEKGVDDISNYQFLIRAENSRKGVHPDSYWKQEFYWDRSFNLLALRAAQRRYAFDMIDQAYRDYFSRPRGEISRLLYLMAMIIGAGKTLAVPMVAAAYNRVIRMEVGVAAPRADRILITTKEAAIRNQIADELKKEMVGYKIASVPPRVLVVDEDHRLTPENIKSYDVCCACIHQLWTFNGDYRYNLPFILAHFPLIFFDELHFGLEQIMAIVRQTDSLCFGLTSTPIKASGDPIKSCRMFSLYDYQAANLNDGSLKYLSTAEADLVNIVEEVGIEDAVIREGLAERTVHDVNDPAYKYALAANKTVAERVVSYVQHCDLMEPSRDPAEPPSLFSRMPSPFGDLASPLFTEAAKHRVETPGGVSVDIWYPMHAMIVVDGVQMAEHVCEQLNHMFNVDRKQFPLAKGYRAEVVRSDFETIDGSWQKAKPLTTDHPWMMYKNHGVLQMRKDGKTVYACRFLVAIGIGREGVNNKFNGVIGVGKQCDSLVEVVQRWLGRQLRAVSERSPDGRLHVPPARLDTPKIITHRAYGNADIIRRGIEFVLDMRAALADIPTLDDEEAIPPAVPGPQEVDTGETLTGHDRVTIAVAVGREKAGLPTEPPGRVVDRIGADSDTKKRRAQAWQDEVTNRPGQAQGWFFGEDELPVIPVVMRESPTCSPSPEDLRRFILQNMPQHVRLVARMEEDPDIRLMAEGWYQHHIRRFHLDEFKAIENLKTIKNSYASQILATFGRHHAGPDKDFKNQVFKLVGSAVKRLLGVTEGKASLGSAWDKPQYHVILCRPSVRRLIVQYVQAGLIRGGFCPDLAQALGVEEGDRTHDEEG